MLIVDNILDAYRFIKDYRVVIFDLDDTLYSEKEYVKSGYREIAKNNPQIENMEDKLWQAFQKGGKAIDEVLLSESLYTEEKAQACLQVYRNQTPKIHLYEGVSKMLQQLVADGIFLGLVTDGRPNGQRAKIKALDIEQYFSKIIITDELGDISFRKPNPIAFEMMHTFFAVPYKNMVYVGDNPAKDFQGPKQLGMECVYFKNSDGLYSV